MCDIVMTILVIFYVLSGFMSVQIIFEETIM